MEFSQYFMCFIIYGFFGWIYESIYYSAQFKKPVNTGFLHVCFCPIYGFACVGNMLLYSHIENSAMIFITSTVVISALEYIVSWLLEHIFEKRWWDYSDWPFNLNGRISLISSLAFGAMSLAQMRFIHPSVTGFVMRMPQRAVYTAIALFMLIIVLDLFITVHEMDKEDEKLWFVNTESPIVQRANEKLSEKARMIADKCCGMRERIKDRMGR